MSEPISPPIAETQEPVVLTQEGYVATIAFNRPEQNNAWLPSMGDTLERFMRQCAADENVRVIVLTGNGKHFSAGADMSVLQNAIANPTAPHAPRARTNDDFAQRHSYLMSIPKPIICAINGACVGVSLVIALFCDIRYASDKAKLSAAFVKRGLVAEHGIAWLLPRLIGLNRAFELLASGRTFHAQEADRIGLVNAVFPDETFRQDVAQAAAALALTVSPRSLRIIKRQIYAGTHSTLAQSAHLAEDELQACLESEDFREGVSHFIEKRPARFPGR